MTEIPKNSPLDLAGQKLIDAAYDFWEECRRSGNAGAIQWLEDTDGQVVIFTRGEYRSQLLKNIQVYEGMETQYFELEGDEDD